MTKPSISSKEISIFIPTKNRPDFLIRVVRYFCRTNFKGPIYVGDSSDLEHIKKMKNELMTLKGKIDVVYNECPGQTGPQAVFNLVAQLSTPYAVYIGDDDFLVPDALVECASFLEESPEFSACCGRGILICHNNEHREMSVGTYGGTPRDVLEETASERYLNFMNNHFVSLFAVRRTEQVKEGYKELDVVADWGFTELLPSCCSVLQGKTKVIDRLSLVRQCHEYQYHLPDTYDWLTNEKWLSSYQQCAKRFAVLLSAKDNVSIEQANETVKKGFWKFLAKGLSRKWEGVYKTNAFDFKESLKRGVKKIPLTTQFWRTLYSYTPNGKMTLPSLLRTSSRYHTDFLSIYQTVLNIKN